MAKDGLSIKINLTHLNLSMKFKTNSELSQVNPFKTDSAESEIEVVCRSRYLV